MKRKNIGNAVSIIMATITTSIVGCVMYIGSDVLVESLTNKSTKTEVHGNERKK